MGQIRKNIETIKAKIKKISHRANLVVVSKYKSSEEILEACAAGQRAFGENRVQEAMEKWPSIKEKYPDIELHLIGALQTNKIKDALKVFDVIEVVDRKKLADKLKNEIDKSGKNPSLLIQVNTADEPQKAGISRSEAKPFIEYCQGIGLNIKGLMCIPPVEDKPEAYFKFLKDLADEYNLPIVSMGMSSDYEIALRNGATHVRVGTAIFGARS